MNINFKEYIKNKRVALVGPSSTLINSSYGNEIDSYDIVVRLNKSIPLPKKYSEDLGTKIDILCNCLESHPHTGGDINPVLWKKHGVKFVLTPFPIEVQKNNAILNTIGNVKKHIDIIYNNTLLYNNNKKILLASPTTGFSCLMYLLSLDIKELKLFGMDFYREMPYKEYFQGKVTWEKAVNAVEKHRKDAKQNLGKQMNGHNIDSEFFYFKDFLYKKDIRLVVDGNLKNILENGV